MRHVSQLDGLAPLSGVRVSIRPQVAEPRVRTRFEDSLNFGCDDRVLASAGEQVREARAAAPV